MNARLQAEITELENCANFYRTRAVKLAGEAAALKEAFQAQVDLVKERDKEIERLKAEAEVPQAKPERIKQDWRALTDAAQWPLAEKPADEDWQKPRQSGSGDDDGKDPTGW